MVRPCFIVIDQEHFGSISTRKLVIESAKMNVITAYSCDEAVETMRKFPAVDGVVFNAEVQDQGTSDVLAELKKINPKVPIILIGTPRTAIVHGVDHRVDSFDPAQLLEVLQRLVPEKTSVLNRHEQELFEKGE